MTRKIIHIDMDAFYASVEQRDNHDLRGKAIAVGGSPNGRGVIATASYEARKYGIKSAMSSAVALRLFPRLIFVKPRFEAYREASTIIQEIFYEYSDLVEPLSLDEAYIDVTENKMDNPSATLIAKEIREKIFFLLLPVQHQFYLLLYVFVKLFNQLLVVYNPLLNI